MTRPTTENKNYTVKNMDYTIIFLLLFQDYAYLEIQQFVHAAYLQFTAKIPILRLPLVLDNFSADAADASMDVIAVLFRCAPVIFRNCLAKYS